METIIILYVIVTCLISLGIITSEYVSDKDKELSIGVIAAWLLLLVASPGFIPMTIGAIIYKKANNN